MKDNYLLLSFVSLLNNIKGREKTLDCKLFWSPQFYKNVFLLVGSKISVLITNFTKKTVSKLFANNFFYTEWVILNIIIRVNINDLVHCPTPEYP